MTKLSLGVLFCLLALLCIDNSDAKVVRGEVKTKDGWAFLTKFCFNNMGVANLTWQIDSPIPGMKLLIFIDGDNWNSVANHLNELTCEQRVAKAHSTRNIINGAVTESPFVDRIRPHYWYFAIANCQPDANGEIMASYNFTFLNGGNSWNTQFSFDEAGLPFAFIFYWVTFTIVAGAHVYGVFVLRRNGGYHPLVKILSVCIALEFFYTMFGMIHYSTYKNNGIGVPGLLGFGEILDIAYQLLFMFLLILLGKGYAISKTGISDRIPMIIVMSLFLVFYLAMFIWEYVAKNPAALYVYESVPGIIILVLRVLVLGWFLWGLKNSFMQETDQSKRNFYLRFGGFYSLWFLILPLIVAISSAVATWIRLKVVMSMYLTMNFLSVAVLTYLFWPSKAEELFNFFGGSSGEGLLSGKSSSPYETL